MLVLEAKVFIITLLASALAMIPVARITGKKKIVRARPRPMNFWFSSAATKKLKMTMTTRSCTVLCTADSSKTRNSVSSVKAFM